MTRINCVDPSILHTKHLVAEVHEITRVFGLVRKAQEKRKNKFHYKIPKEYTLGTGHVLFHYDKLQYVCERYERLCDEMRRRGFKTSQIASEELVRGVDKSWLGGYCVTQEAREINLSRLKEKMPDWY